MVFHVFIFIFCLEPTLEKKDAWTRETSVTVIVIFSNVLF